jgi:L-ascorbate metabolism protein UlaG (beta-lactamase superfamily)
MNRRALLRTGVAIAALPVLASLRAAAQVPMWRLRVQRLSWAGAKLVCDDATLFVDATYDPASSSGASPEVPLVADTRNKNALITHHHGDHFDGAALRAVLGESGIVVVPDAVAPWADTRQLRVQAARLYEPVILPRGTGTFMAISVPAVDGLGHPQVSWVIDAGGKRVFHGGDTAWHGHWWDIARAYGPFDLALLPINGFRQVQGRYTDSGVPMSLTPEQAAAAASILRARLAVPIHYGGASAGYFEVADAPEHFVAAARARGVETKVVAPGGWIDL